MKNRRYDSNSIGRYSEAPGKVEKVDKKINNHFIFNMSSEDYKTFGNPSDGNHVKKNIGNINDYL